MTREAARACWCEAGNLKPYSPEYRLCKNCGTLVSQVGLSEDALVVQDDDEDFYGKNYWLAHQQEDLGNPDILQRARQDLPERCLHWLHTLLAYRLPPARVLELGCAHGGFVALLRWSGYEASGLELSPWVVDYARRTFDIPVHLGPVGEQGLAEGSLGVIVLNDVLEHLPDPRQVLGDCARLLADDGLLVVQMPDFPEGRTFAEMTAAKARFLQHVENKGNQHLYLYSQRAARRLLGGLGFGFVNFEPPMFDYDMYFVASRRPLVRPTAAERDASLQKSAAARLVLALLDADRQGKEFIRKLGVAEADRAARLEVILRQGEEMGVLQSRLHASEAERAALWGHLEASEADRAARLAVIERCEADRARLSREFEALPVRVVWSASNRLRRAVSRGRRSFGNFLGRIGIAGRAKPPAA
jgi:2-polyprenyl-3-methyl-5-hydroxy-6-metoxy-1,4-benzoquinol methylase